jgi:hypothetical protein
MDSGLKRGDEGKRRGMNELRVLNIQRGRGRPKKMGGGVKEKKE